MAELTEATALELLAATDALREDVGVLSRRIAEYGERLDGNERRAKANRLGIGILALIAAAIGFIAWQNYQTNTEQRATAAQQEILLRDFICPSSALLVGGYRPDTRPPGEARDAYADSIEGLRAARERQRCTDALVPPAQPVPAPEPTEGPR